MAILDASAASRDFSLTAAFTGGVYTATDTEFTYGTNGGGRIRFLGDGLAYDALNTPVAGQVHAVFFDYDPFDGVSADAYISSNISFSVLDLVSRSDPASGEISFWQHVLGGNDTITAPLTKAGLMTGDFTSVLADFFDLNGKTLAGGNDTFTAANTAWSALSYLGGPAKNALVGDALVARGTSVVVNGHPLAISATVAGGNDSFTVSGFSYFNITGDVQDVQDLGHVSGGADTIVSTVADRAVDPRVVYYSGDAEINAGVVTGGKDSITGSNSTVEEVLSGDVLYNNPGGYVTGGADVIAGRGGSDQIAGDIDIMQGGTLVGGNDTIRGGNDAGDIISGDVFRIYSSTTPALVTITGGNDVITGDDGNDVLCGDLFDTVNVGAASTITGGNDVLYGGAGVDLVYGDMLDSNVALLDGGGDDIVDGGLGDDFLYGQLGNDTLSFGTVAQAVTVDLMTGVADGQGHDIFTGFENITGSSQNDRLFGDAGVNRISGGAGIDAIQGRGGGDKLYGQDGNDAITGGLGRDTMDGGAGADRFIYRSTAESGITSTTRDSIVNWDASDVIDVSAIDSGDADHAFNVITSGEPVKGEMRIVTSLGRVVLEFNTDTDAAYEMTIEIRTSLAVTAADFIL